MNFVQPIRDPEYIRVMKNFLREKSERNYILFVAGINSGLRISDLLPLRGLDAKRPYFTLVEKKTRKQKRIAITLSIQRELREYIKDKEDHEFLLKSREGINKPMGRSMAYKILNEAADYVSLEEIGTHTLRKPFGDHFYMQYKDVAMLQEIFNHSSPDITLKY